MMKALVLVAAFGSFAALAAAQTLSSQQQPPPPPPPAVHVGQAAPDFELPYLQPAGENKWEQKKVKLSDFKGKKNVVLAFFPAAFSPG